MCGWEPICLTRADRAGSAPGEAKSPGYVVIQSQSSPQILCKGYGGDEGLGRGRTSSERTWLGGDRPLTR